MRNGRKIVGLAHQRVAPFIAVVGLLVTSTAASSQTTYVGYPDSIAVLGHSGATGYDSDPRYPRTDVRANSWATGTNPAVNSLYLRILGKNPRIKRHNINLAQDGATVRELLVQAKAAVSFKQKPNLFVIQIMDNDIVCPATKGDYTAFRAGLVSALKVLARGAPDARMFVVSQFGSPGTYAKALSPDQRRSLGGTGPCDLFDTSGRLVPKRLANLEHVSHGYEAQLAAGCRRVANCRSDGGAFGRVVDQRAFISGDLNHFSIRGHAMAAAVAWSAMKRVGLVPR